MTEANKYKLGIFITFAIVLIFISFFISGLSKFFEPKLEVLTVFSTSVEGLKIGSPVKYKGVTLGRITRIAMRNTDNYIDVYMVIFSTAMDSISDSGKKIHRGDTTSLTYYFKNLVAKGMSCSIQASGIMGGAFIEFDTGDSPKGNGKQSGLINIKVPPDILYIPSRPSHITDVIENLSLTAESLSKIDFVKLYEKLKNTLETVDSRLNDPRIDDLVAKMDKIFTELSEVFDKSKFESIVKELQACLKSINALVKKTDVSRENISADIEELKMTIDISLSKVNRAMDSISGMAQQFEEDPSSVITGKKKPQIFEE